MEKSNDMKGHKDLLKSSILKIQEKDRRIRELEAERDEPVAIIGLSCRFPGAADPEAFWTLIEDGKDAVTTMTDQRWHMDDYYSPNAGEPGKIYTRRFGLLEEVDQFDPAAFGISEAEAAYIDPQHRILLEQAWFCFERAGIDVSSVKGANIGVYIGQMNSDYERLIKSAGDINPYVGIGNALSAAAGRLAYVFGLKGPSMALDTACSSSMVAVHLACQSLRMGECTMALAGGVNLLLSPEAAIGASVAHMLSAQGRCNTFGNGADGYVRSEGCGLVLLKTLSRAQADGDTILAVIRGSAVNQDGRSHGLSAPNGPAQIDVIRRALANAQVDPAEVGYLEAHGTGTPLGDPVEVQAVDTVYGCASGRRTPLVLGAVKANIGHCESAAGVAGLIKLVLLLQRGRLPPIAHLGAMNPHFEDLNGQLLFPKGIARMWNSERPRIAALSSFGYTGTNAHLLLSEYVAAPVPAPPSSGVRHAFCFSAHTGAALRRQLVQLAQRARSEPQASLQELAAAVNRIRSDLPYRFGFLAGTSQELLDSLDAGAGTEFAVPPAKPSLVLLFDGAGSFHCATDDQQLRFRIEAAAGITLERLNQCDDRPALNRLVAQWLHTEALAACGLQPQSVRGAGSGALAALVCAHALTIEQAVALAKALDAALPTALCQSLLADLELAEARLAVCLNIGHTWHELPHGRPDEIKRLLAEVLASTSDLADTPWQPESGALEIDILRLAPVSGAGRGNDTGSLASLIVALFSCGLSPRWRPAGTTAVLPLPDYPFDRRRCWVPDYVTSRVASLPLLFGSMRHGVFTTVLAEPDGGSLFAGELSLARLPFLRDHVVAGAIVLPASAYLDMIAEACSGAGGSPVRVEHLRIMQPCVLGSHPLGVYCRLGAADGVTAAVDIFTKGAGDGEWRHHVSASVNEPVEQSPRHHALDVDRKKCPVPVALGPYRAQARRAGIDYGPAFQAITSLSRGVGVALAKVDWPVSLPREWAGRGLHPVMLDACFQAIGAAIGETQDVEAPAKLFVPVEIHGLRDSGLRPDTLWCLVRILGPEAAWESESQVSDYLRQRENLSVALLVYDEQGHEVMAIERFEAARYQVPTPQEAWRDWLWEKHWVPMKGRGAGLSIAADALLELAQPHFGPAHYVADEALFQDFDELAGLYISQAFRELGVVATSAPSAEDLVQGHAVLPAYLRLVRRLLALQGHLPTSGRTAQDVEAALRRSLGSETRELDLLVRCGGVLADVLRGRVNALDLLFESAHADDTEALYQDSAGSLALNDRVAALAAQAAASMPPDRKLRILEVGAGTGATTSRVLSLLGGRDVDYVFTDLSAHFLRRAEEKFRDAGSFQYRVFDLEADPRGQGFEPGQFDLIIAVNVVHVTADLARALDHLSQCLADGGMLLLREVTRPQAWLDLTFGLTPGWWNFSDGELRQEGPLLDPAGWVSLLSERGFEPVLATDEPGRTESIFVARKQARRATGHWVVFADGDAWSEQLGNTLALRGMQVSQVGSAPDSHGWQLQSRDGFIAMLDDLEQAHGPITGIVYAWSLHSCALDEGELASAAERYLKYPLLLCQALLQPRWRHLSPNFLTAGAQAVAAAVTQPLQALLWGHVFAFVNENATFARLIDIDATDAFDASMLDVLEQTEECQLALRDGRAMVARLRAAPLAVPPARTISAQASYLITGGFGDLGLQTAKLLAAQGARHLILLGRSVRAESELVLDTLRAQGVQIHALHVDVGDEAALQSALDGLLPGLPALRGVVHSVGVLDDGVIEQQNWERYLRVLRPKVFGAIHLHRAVAACELDFFVIYSSAAALMGNPGQANHAAANAFLDAFASYRRGAGHPGLAIGWGAWSGIGAAAARNIGARLSESDSIAGTITPEQGLAVIAQQFQCTNVQFAVLPLNLRKRLDAQRQPQVQRLLADLLQDGGPQASGRIAAQTKDFLAQLYEMSVPQRRRHLETHLQRIVAGLLKHTGTIEAQASLFDHGLDSLLAIDLRGILEKDFVKKFDSTLLFDYPSIATLAEFLIKSLPSRGADTPVEASAILAPAAAAQADGAIAVVGMACRFPGGANTPEQFWELLKNGVDTVSGIPVERWDHSRYFDRERGKPGKAYVAEGCFVDQVDQFYPERFGIAGIEAELMDPQQRMLLDVSYEAFESAGVDPTALDGSETGVFMGVMTQDYLHLSQHVRENAFYVGTGSANSVVAGRISHAFGLMGPSMTIDTACSSSLVTVQMACANLRSGACDMALAGGVSLQLSPEPLILECAGGMLSPSGRCSTFDAAADGFVRGEGCGVVVLKRLADAISENDNILGVIRGGAVTHNGHAGGLTVPSGLSQQRVLERALEDAAVDPSEVSYIEAHGTGTLLGDPIELNALQAVFGRTPRATPLHIASVKTNIGHAEAAAGVAGLIKVLLCMRHRMLAPHLHFQKPNPNFEWENSALAVADQLQPWDSPRIAGVSSFGLSGTNAHVVLEEYAKPADCGGPPAGFVPLAVLSHVSCEQLAGDAARYAQALASSSLAAVDVAYTMSMSRAGQPIKAVLPAASIAQLLEGLRALAGDATAAFEKPGTEQHPLTWHLPLDVEPRWARFAALYYDQYAAFRDTIDACADALRVHGYRIEPPRALCTDEAAPLSPRLRAGVLGLAYGRLLQALNVRPEGLHAQGAMLFCAAALSGAASIETMLAGLIADDEAGVRMAMAALRLSSGDVPFVFGPGADWSDELNQVCAVSCATAFPYDTCVVQASALDLFAGLVGSDQDPELSTLVVSLAKQGRAIDWHSYFAPARARIVNLPTSHFPARRYWVPGHASIATAPSALIVADLTSARDGQRYVDFALDSARQPYLDEHAIGATNVLPAAATLAFVLHALGRDALAAGVLLEGLTFLRPLRFEQRLNVQLAIGAEGRSALHFRSSDASAWQSFASVAKCGHANGLPAGAGTVFDDLRAIRDNAPSSVDGAAFYATYLPLTLRLGASYQRIERIWRDGQCAVAKIRTLDADFLVDPRALDACLQTVNVFADALEVKPDGLFLPYTIGRAELFGWPEGESFWCLTRYLPQASGSRELVYDIIVIDEHGRLCARFQQASFRKVATLAAPAANSGLLHQLTWDVSSLPANVPSGLDGALLLIGRERPLLSDLQALLGPCVYRVWPKAAAQEPTAIKRTLRVALDEAGGAQALIYADLLDETDQDLSPAAWTERVQDSLWYLAQWLVAASEAALPVIVLTRASQSIEAGGIPLSSVGHAATALVRTAALEFPSLRVTLVDLDQHDALDWLAEVAGSQPGAVVAYRQGMRYLPALKPAPMRPPVSTVPAVRPSRTYVISGGLGGIGLLTAELLVDQGAEAIALLARSVRPETEQRVEQLRQRGCKVQVFIDDIGDPDSVRTCMQQIVRDMPPVAGILHAAGTLSDAMLKYQNIAQWRQVFSAKVQGALNLFEASTSMELDFFVLFSSIVSVVGSAGQANYAVANGLLDSLAQRWAAQGVPAMSINWGAWADTGMARKAQAAGVQFRDPLSSEEALAELVGLLRYPMVQVAVCRVDDEPDALAAPPDLTVPQANVLGGNFFTLPDAEQATLVTDVIRERLIGFLKIASNHVSDDRPFFDLGLDSVTAVSFTSHLSETFALKLHVDTIFDHPSVSSLAGHVLRLLLADRRPVNVAEQQVPPPEVSMSIDDLSMMLDLELNETDTNFILGC